MLTWWLPGCICVISPRKHLIRVGAQCFTKFLVFCLLFVGQTYIYLYPYIPRPDSYLSVCLFLGQIHIYLYAYYWATLIFIIMLIPGPQGAIGGGGDN